MSELSWDGWQRSGNNGAALSDISGETTCEQAQVIEYRALLTHVVTHETTIPSPHFRAFDQRITGGGPITVLC